MKLTMSQNSPYARRARLVIREGGLSDRVEEVGIAGLDDIPKVGPGGKIPVLETDTGVQICESLVICDYLNGLCGGKLKPEDPAALERCLAEESLGVVLLDSLFARFMENVIRQEGERSAALLEREEKRSRRCLDALEGLVSEEEAPVTLANIMVMSALGAAAALTGGGEHWREGRPRLSAYYDRLMSRPAFQETAPDFG